MKIYSYAKQSPRKVEREDAHFMNERASIFGVLDGVTPLDDFRDAAGHNGAYIAANLFKQYFETKPEDQTIELIHGIMEANSLLKREMEQHQIEMNELHKRWATCLVAVHIQQDQIQYAQLGDCMLVARYHDGTVSVLTTNRVATVGERSKARRESERAQGHQLPEEDYFDTPRHQWIYQRWMANTPEGYGVANGMEEASDYIQSGQLHVSDISHLLLLSDGLFCPEMSLQETFQWIIDYGFEHYVDKVEREEQLVGASPDDRTGILLVWV